MKMKKTIAGVLASIVAISAMATSMVSAADTIKEFDMRGQVWGVTMSETLELSSLAFATTQTASTVLSFAAPATAAYDFTSVSLTVIGTNTAATAKDKTQTFALKDAGNGVFTLTVLNDGAAATSAQFNPALYGSIDSYKIAVTTKQTTSSASALTLLKNAGKGTIGVTVTAPAAAADAALNILDAFNDALIPDVAYTFSDPVAGDPAKLFGTGVGDWQGTIYDMNSYSKFAGLAQQAAIFFQGHKDGKIIFTISDKDVSTVTDLPGGGLGGTNNGGIWLGGWSEDHDVNDIALAVNWDSTGALVSATTVDKTAGTVTFDWAKLAAAFGGNTTGNIHNIGYVLNAATDAYLTVEKVSFSYASTPTDPTDESSTEVAVPESSVVVDDSSAVVDESSPVVDESSTSNPGTGSAPIALAIIPVALAAAAIFASKKKA